MCLKNNELDVLEGFNGWKNALPKEVVFPSEAVHLSSIQVYGDAYSLCVEICKLCTNLDHTYKYSLGEQVRMTAFNLVLELQKSCGADIISHIRNARNYLSEVQLCLRLLVDLNVISQKRFVSLVEMTDKISHQLISWERSKKLSLSAGVSVQ